MNRAGRRFERRDERVKQKLKPYVNWYKIAAINEYGQILLSSSRYQARILNLDEKTKLEQAISTIAENFQLF